MALYNDSKIDILALAFAKVLAILPEADMIVIEAIKL